ncbi:MAG: Uma2 family endonuclease [Verrucomicrobiales bacterium]|jgi:Uma2 family endonuclease
MELAAPLIGQEMSLQDFRDWDQGDLGGAKYEWRDGELEEKPGGWMKPEELRIVLNLEDWFHQTEAFKQGHRLISETSFHLEAIKATRIPDMAYLTLQQLCQAEEGLGKALVPLWVIEIISPSDRVFDIEDKTQEYFDSGVQLVWQIFPRHKRVGVLRSSIQDVSLLTVDAICSAAPVLPEFEIRVCDVFKSRKG